eukprot:979341-Amphidinium_carterae.1
MNNCITAGKTAARGSCLHVDDLFFTGHVVMRNGYCTAQLGVKDVSLSGPLKTSQSSMANRSIEDGMPLSRLCCPNDTKQTQSSKSIVGKRSVTRLSGVTRFRVANKQMACRTILSSWRSQSRLA